MKRFACMLTICLMGICIFAGAAFAAMPIPADANAALESYQGEWLLYRMCFGSDWLKPEEAGYQGFAMKVEGEAAQIIYRDSPMDFSCSVEGGLLKLDTDYDDRFDTSATLYEDGSITVFWPTPYGNGEMHMVRAEAAESYAPPADAVVSPEAYFGSWAVRSVSADEGCPEELVDQYADMRMIISESEALASIRDEEMASGVFVFEKDKLVMSMGGAYMEITPEEDMLKISLTAEGYHITCLMERA